MNGSDRCYESGDEIRVGDRVDYAGHPGTVVFVLATRSFSPDFPEEYWSYLGRGFMLDVEGMGLVHFEEADEDLFLVARA